MEPAPLQGRAGAAPAPIASAIRGYPSSGSETMQAFAQNITDLDRADRAASLKAADDSELVIRFLDGEERAFNELVERYNGRLLNFVYRTTGDRQRAEDLV